MNDAAKQKAIAALKQCKRELQGWQKAHGTDLDSQEAIIAADAALHVLENGG